VLHDTAAAAVTCALLLWRQHDGAVQAPTQHQPERTSTNPCQARECAQYSMHSAGTII